VLPLLLIFYLSIFAFSIKDIVLAGTLILGSTSGLLAYAFVIQTISPLVGYFMLSDYLFIFVLMSIFIIFLITILYAVPEHIASKRVLDTIKGFTIPLLYILLVVVWYYLTNVRGMG
jgi:cytochrome c oxidase subunit IV